MWHCGNVTMNFFFKLSLWFVRVGLFLALATPFVVFESTVFPYLFGKIVFFQIIIEIIFPFFVYLALRNPEYRPKRNVIFYALAGYLAVLLFSGIFGVDFLRSFWGYRERSDGIFTMLHFFAFFAMLQGAFRSRREWFWFFNSLLVGGLIVVSNNFLTVSKAIFDAGKFFLPREGGLSGNVIFYAGFALFEVFIALSLFSAARRKREKIFYIFAAAIFILAVFLSLTRGAMLAALATAFLALIVWALGGSRQKKIIALSGIAAMLIIFVGLFFVRNASFISENQVLSRLLNISISDDTGETRALAWGSALKGFAERPVLGWGYTNFYVPFNKFYNPKLLSHSVNETWFDRAHNIVFEHLAGTGALGLAAYLFLLGAIVYAAWESKDMTKRVLGFGIVAYFLQNLFAIDNPSAYLAFYIIAAYVSSGAKEIIVPQKPEKINFLKFILLAAVSVASIYFIYYINIKSFIAGNYELRAALLAENNLEESLSWYRRALSVSSPWRSEAIMAFVKTVVSGVQSQKLVGEAARLSLEEAKNQLDEATIRRNKISAYDYYLMGRLYSEWGKFDGAYFPKAEEALELALELSPLRQQIYYGYGRAKILAGKPAEALPLFRKMVELNPEVAESHWYLGLEYNELGMPEAIDEIVLSYDLGYSPRTMGEARLMMDALVAKKELFKIPRIYDDLISGDPKNASLYAELAALYAKLGDKDKARAAALRAMEVDQSFEAEGRIFLKQLDAAK